MDDRRNSKFEAFFQEVKEKGTWSETESIEQEEETS